MVMKPHMQSVDQPELRAPEHYINRELSLLEFNERVLAQALDATNPLLERLKFLCISSANLDEFFEIRVAGLKQRLELGTLAPGVDGSSIPEQLRCIHARTMHLIDSQARCLNEVILPQMRA
jgi:polyphosphate kinase